MTPASNEAPLNPISSAVRPSSFHRWGGLVALAASLPLVLVACAGGDDAPSTGGASGAGGSTGGSGGANGGTAGASGGTGGAAAGTGGAGGATGGASGSGGSGGALPKLYQGFTFELVEAAGDVGAFTRFSGYLYDGPYPPAFPLTLDTTDGDCQLWIPTNAPCPAGCSNGVCTAAAVCTPFPTAVSGGSITVSGIEGGQFTVMPQTTRFVYMQASALPNPPCAEGSSVTVAGPGYNLETKCVSPLVLTTAEPIPVMAGSTVDLAWEPAGAQGMSRIQVKLDIAHHGGRKGEIQCDVPDTGSFSIPAALVDKLIGLGLAGFPTIGVKRISMGTSTEQTDLTLVMAAPVERAVDTGVASCNEDVDCDDGQVCTDKKVCE